ncbi:MAG: ABC transporter substrate-binding protein [Desulfomicrobiaceae bacterium]|nr:ABC transporter substrate-binding protein [Desulfomicrobiaceae bacterium]
MKTSAGCVAAASVASLGFPAILRAAPKEIAIGHIHPLSGFLAFDGQELQNGLMLAVQEINAAGGIKSMGGAQLKVLTADSEGKPELAIKAMERLVQEGAVSVIGCYQSAVTLVATQMAEKLGVPFVVSVAVADEVTARGFKYTFRVQPNAKQMATQTVQNLSAIVKASGVPAKTIAYIHDDTAFGQSLAGHVAQVAPEEGFELLLEVPYSPKAPDFTTEVGKIKATNADLVMATGYFGDSVRVYKTMKDLRVAAKAVVGCGNGAFSHPKFVKELGAITNYVMDGNYQANRLSPRAQAAFANYEKRYGTPMGTSTVFAYQAVYVVADALERAATDDRQALRDALAKTHLTDHILPQGPIVFGEDGQNINAAAPMMQILDGRIQVVWPKEYAQADPVFPVPSA